MAKFKYYDGTQWVELATKSTTLAGYGITDAKIANGTITLGSNSITPITSHYTNTLTFYTKSGNTSSQILQFDQSAGRSITFKGSGTVSVSAVSSGNTSTEVTITGSGSASQATTSSLGTIKVHDVDSSNDISDMSAYSYSNPGYGFHYGVKLDKSGKAYVKVIKNFWVHNVTITASNFRVTFLAIANNNYYSWNMFSAIAFELYQDGFNSDKPLMASGIAGSGKYVYGIYATSTNALRVLYQSSNGAASYIDLNSSSSGYTVYDIVEEVTGYPTYR